MSSGKADAVKCFMSQSTGSALPFTLKFRRQLYKGAVFLYTDIKGPEGQREYAVSFFRPGTEASARLL